MKWEDQIKETLEKRTIMPSHESWGLLADKLNAADHKKVKKSYLWMGVAASVVAILLTMTIFFNGNNRELQNPILVDTEEQVDDSLFPIEKLPVGKHLEITQQNNKIDEPSVKNSATKEFLNKQSDVVLPKNEEIIVAQIHKDIPTEPLDINQQDETLEDAKILEIVAQIQNLKSEGHIVTDANIDALLAQAQKEIKYQSIIKEGTLTVDANALLQDVESDLQQSFRNKIFEALKNSYETVKTAVAERNN